MQQSQPARINPLVLARPLSDAQLEPSLGLGFRKHLSLPVGTFLPELTALARAAQEVGKDAQAVRMVVHRVRYDRCKRAWDQGEVDVDVDVTAGDILDAAREIRDEARKRSERDADPVQDHGTKTSPSDSTPPEETVLEIPFSKGSPEHTLELQLGKMFGRTRFREYFDIDPVCVHHQTLRSLAQRMQQIGLSPSEIQTRLSQARDDRLANRKTGTMGAGRRAKAKVTHGDIVEVSETLQPASVKPATVPAVSERRTEKRVPERTDNAVVQSSSTTPAARRTSKRLLATPPVRRVKLRIALPPPPSQSLDNTASSSRRHVPESAEPRTSRVQQAQAQPYGMQVDPPASPPLPTAVTSPPAPALTRPRGLSAMDQLMIQSFQTISASAPEALVEGQEMTLKIGRGTDGRYFFTHQLQSVVSAPLPLVETSTRSQPSSSRAYPYRIDPVSLDDLDDVVRLRRVLPSPPGL